MTPADAGGRGPPTQGVETDADPDVTTAAERARPLESEAEHDDDLFVGALKTGDSAAFTALYRRYHRSMSRVAEGYVGTPSVAEEVVQETWLAVFEGIASFQQRSRFRTWLFAILVNRARARGRRERRTLPFSALSTASESEASTREEDDGSALATRGLGPVFASASSSPEKQAMQTEVARILEQAIERLPVNYRIVLTMRDVEDLESASVCTVLGISEENQRVLLHRARARLRALLGPLLGDAC